MTTFEGIATLFAAPIVAPEHKAPTIATTCSTFTNLVAASTDA